jgi:hypothetical protein
MTGKDCIQSENGGRLVELSCEAKCDIKGYFSAFAGNKIRALKADAVTLAGSLG